MMSNFAIVTLFFWILFVIYWIIDIYRISKKTVKQELRGLISLVGTALVVYLPVHFWIFGDRILSSNFIINLVGVLICGTGILFAVWAREFPGKSWSAAVAVQKEHVLIQKGPYAIVRHPMYTGLLFALIGSAIAVNAVWGFVVTVFLVLGIIGKIKAEEQLLATRFPQEYQKYKRKVRMLIPFIL